MGRGAYFIADRVREVVAVDRKEAFGVPGAFWVTRVEGFLPVVTMDTHGKSVHGQVEATAKAAWSRLMGS